MRSFQKNLKMGVKRGKTEIERKNSQLLGVLKNKSVSEFFF